MSELVWSYDPDVAQEERQRRKRYVVRVYRNLSYNFDDYAYRFLWRAMFEARAWAISGSKVELYDRGANE